MIKKFELPFYVFIFVFFVLSMIQAKVESPLIILERFFMHGGWIEIPIIAFYGGFITYKMQESDQAPKWRKITWSVFSFVFFSQLILGILISEKFLMTGKLHLPIPMMILGGPVYRAELSFMTILFISTVILTGPAWCSQLCYFGAIDGLMSSGKTNLKPYKNKFTIKYTLVFSVIFFALVFRFLNISVLIASILAVLFGLGGIFIIFYFSKNKGKMVHCTLYCPIGTLVNYFKFINPFRIQINSNCTSCMKCTSICKYDALNKEDIANKKPGITCTLCGDCLPSCHVNSIHYNFFKTSPVFARNLYLFLTLSVHAIFLALARI